MSAVEIKFNEVDAAISVIREVAAWGRAQGYRVWLNASKCEAAYLHTLYNSTYN